MKRNLGITLAATGLLTCGLAGCEVGSPDKAYRSTGLSIAGYYTNPGTTVAVASVAAARVVSSNSGAPISTLNLRQSGNQLEAIDNNGTVLRGTIGTVSGSTATLVLSGTTTAGSPGVLDATVSVAGTRAVMRGTWAEGSLYGVVYGEAVVQGAAPTPTPTPTNTTMSIRSSGAFPRAAAVRSFDHQG
jgi:hypothetical protein